MALGDIQTLKIPVTLDYLALPDTILTLVPLSGEFAAAFFDLLTSTIVDVSGRNNIRKTVVVITGREIV